MTSCSKILQVMLSIVLFLCIEYIQGQEVWIHNGDINGINLTTRNGRNIEAFLGIPYAKPPIGPLRFKAPVKADPWDDILIANTDCQQCPQLHDGQVVGGEDCLCVNVYTPKILITETKYLLPTMVYFHGGHFVRGNGSSMMVGPQFLLDKDIVFVTVNYRLEVLGFISIDDPQASGNFGLKDQVLALKWVRDNIVFFGGDPDKVTIFGQDAGGVSAQLHSISDASAGLFNQYISQSGTSTCLWAYVEPIDCKDNAVKLGKHLNCSTTNSEDLVNCLREVDVKSLVDSDDIFDDKTYRFKTWGPTEEPQHGGAFLTMFPYYKVAQDGTHIHRSIIGHVADEGLMLTARKYFTFASMCNRLFLLVRFNINFLHMCYFLKYYSDPGLYKKVANNPEPFIQQILDDFYNFPTPKVYVNETEEFYFNGIKPSDKETFTKNMTNLISNTFFLQPADEMAHTMISTSNVIVYFYSFEYRGAFSKTSWVIGNNENIGVTHGDDLIYLLPSTEKFKRSESDEEMIDTMIDLWCSFADSGIPSTKRFPDPNFWKPYGDDRDYLQIGNNSDTSLSRRDNFDEKRLKFLNYQQFQATHGSYFKNVHGLRLCRTIRDKITILVLHWCVSLVF